MPGTRETALSAAKTPRTGPIRAMDASPGTDAGRTRRPSCRLDPAVRCGEDEVVTYIIAEPCVDLLDKACIEECPVDCIYEGNRMLYIHPDECVDCGACEPVCPVEAIFYEDDVPQQWKDYTAANYEFFEDLGSPGGASKMGKIEKDATFVAAQPPREVEH